MYIIYDPAEIQSRWVGLVTFKYMTVRKFKIGSGTRENGNQMYSSNLGTIFNILPVWEKCVLTIVYLSYVCFGVYV